MPDDNVMSEIEASMRTLIGHVVDRVPGVRGALVSSADGFVLSARLPDATSSDAASIAAMSAAVVGLSNRLVQTVGETPTRVTHIRSDDAQTFVFTVAHAATFTVLTSAEADGRQVVGVGREITQGLLRLFRGTADV